VKLRRVEVEWVDSVNAGGWHVPHEAEAFCDDPGPILYTLGYVERRTKKYLILAQSIHGTNRANMVAIPHSAIQRVRKLK
jgi:hypothetical protein